MYETISGYPPLIARHFRESRCGSNIHIVCVDGACASHIDRWNPDCDGELLAHMRDDFWPAFRTPILIGMTLLAAFAITRL